MLPRLSPLEAQILQLLISNAKMYGMEMVEASDGRLKRGTIYVTLNRMEDKGLVRSEAVSERGRSGMPRRYYEMTGLGARTAHAMEVAGAILSGEAGHAPV